MQDIQNGRFNSHFEGRYQKQPERRMRGKGFWIAIVLTIAALVIVVAIIQARYAKPAARNIPELPPPHAVANVNAPSPVELSASFREVAKAVKPAVVFISVEGVESEGPILGPRRREGAGSGFIVTDDGYILTNNHVVGGANKINVTLADGRKFKAEVIGADRETDLAVIKIDAAGLPTAVLGDSDEVEQGDWVLALGSPFGLQQTLTAGIVSATGRELSDSQFNRYIQTDASINPGNSGGPLVNMQGQVIGINTMILTGGPFNQGNIGIGFAIASNVARGVFDQLVRGGKVTRGYLGVFVQQLDEARANLVGLEPNTGVFVAGLTNDNSPAAKAGIQKMDVITAYDGKPVKAPRDLTDAVAATAVGKTVRVDFIRNGQPQSVTVQIAERPGPEIASQANPPDFDIPSPGPEQGEQGERPGRLGILGQTVTREMGARMKLKEPSGVLVMSVQPGSPASEAGIEHGDVIHSIGRNSVKSVGELVEALKAIPDGGKVAIEIERGGRITFVTVAFE